MQGWTPRNIVLLGLVLVLLGAILPFLMVMGILESSFFLSFFSFASSVAGLFLGIIGASMYIRKNRK